MIYGLVKLGTEAIISAGVGTVVGSAFKTLIPPATSKVTKVLVQVGVGAVSGYLGHTVSKHYSGMVDEVRDLVGNIRGNKNNKDEEVEGE